MPSSTTSTPKYLELQLFTRRPLRQEPIAQQLVNLLESKPFLTPTKYGEDSPTKLPYIRKEFIKDYTTKIAYNLLFRHEAPKYEMDLPTSSNHVDALYIHFEPTENHHVTGFYDVATGLAELLEPLFGTVQSNWSAKDSPEIFNYRQTGHLTRPQFDAGGPAGFASRTWFGPELVGLIGKARLTALGQPLKWMNYGGVAVDVVEDVTEADFLTLMAAQRTLTDALADVGVFRDYTLFYNAKPGAAWAALRKERNLF